MPTLTPVDFDPFGAEAPPAARKLTPVDFNPFEGEVEGLPPLSAEAMPENRSGPLTRGGRRNPQPTVAPTPPAEELPFFESLFESAKAGLSGSLGGTVQGIAEKAQAPFAALEGTALGELVRPAVEFYDPAIAAGKEATALADALRQGASVGAINPQSLDELAGLALSDPEGTLRFMGNIGAESAPAILMAMATRNPRAAERLMGLTTYGTTYGQQRAAGADMGQAEQQAITAALIEAVSSRAPAEAVLGGAPLGRRLVQGPTLEAGSEAAAGGLQASSSDIIAGRPVDDERAILEAVIGAGVGGPLGLGEAVLGRGPERAPAATTPPAATPAAPPGPNAPPAPAPAASEAELDALLTQNLGDVVPPEVAQAVAANPEAVEQLLTDPNIAAALDALVAPPTEAKAPAVPTGQGGSPSPAGADSPPTLAHGFKVGPEAGTRYRVTASTGGALGKVVVLDKRNDRTGSADTFIIAKDGTLVDADSVNHMNPATKDRLWIPESDKARDDAVEILDQMGALDLYDPKRKALKDRLKALVTGKPASKTDPVLPESERDTAPVGSRVDGGNTPGLGRTVWEIRDVPLDSLVLPEVAPDGTIPSAGRDEDAARYAQDMRRGDTFPNARGFQLDDGRVKLADGNRRAVAARAAGRTSLAVAVATYPDEAAPKPSRATPEQLDTALAMDEDAYIKAVNPSGKRSSAEDEIAFSPGDIQAPADAVPQPDLAFTDKAGRAVSVVEAKDGTLYAVVDGQTVGLVESSNGETLNQVAKSEQGKGIGAGLIRAQLLRDPMTPAGSFSAAGEAARRSAFRKLKAERAVPTPLGQAAVAPSRGQSGLFAPPSARETVEAARRDRDAERDGRTGTGRTDMAAGRGELFAGPRPAQADIADVPTSLATDAGVAPAPSPSTPQPDRSLSFLRGEIGWTERGGRLLRAADDAPTTTRGASDAPDATGAQGSVIGRSKWMPKTDPGGRPSNFWRNRPGRITEAEANAAFDRLERGEPLTKKQQAFVDYARKTADDYQAADREQSRASAPDPLDMGTVPESFGPDDDVPFSRSVRRNPERLQQQDGTPQESQIALDREFDQTVERARGTIRNLQAETGPIARAIRKALGPAFRDVEILASRDTLPDDVKARVRIGADTEGFLDPQTGIAYVFADVVGTPERGVWVAFHERAGHFGLRQTMLDAAKGDRAEASQRIVELLDEANANPTLGQLASAIRAENPDYDRVRATEEAIAEVSAAVRTGDYGEIQSRYRVTVPQAQRDTLRGYITRLVQRIRQFFAKLFGRPGVFTDAEVYQLIEDSWKKAKTARGATGGDAVEARDGEQPTFYSAMLQAVERGQGAPRRGDAAAWKGWLDGAVRRGEFKQGERDWLGIDAWLAGRQTTTREELAEFIRANEVQVQDVVLGRPNTDRIVERIDAINEELWNLVQEQGRPIPDMAPEARARAEALRDEHDRLVDEDLRNAENSRQPTKFSQYQLPGGQNYRELLLTMPERESGAPTQRPRVVQLDDGRWRVESVTDRGTPILYPVMGLATREEAESHADKISKKTAENASAFRSSHFDQPNILAHVRFNERTDADGKRVLFIEEIQSDWHQQGRKRGYKGHRPGDARIAEAQRSFDESAARGENAGDWRRNNPEDAAILQADFRDDAAVPNAPFKGTDEWVMLAFKRMARHAVDNGFDRIAWTTGDQQNARYDLSKQVKSISVVPLGDGSRVVDLLPNGQELISFSVDNRGVVSSKQRAAAQFDGKPLDEVVGKDMAEKIMATTGSATFTGTDLAIGGEGMRSFYDKILPSAVNKWAKKFGGKVGDVTFDDSPKGGRLVMGEDGTVSRDAGDRVLRRQHGLDITPAMREAVASGQPLFSRARTDGRGQRMIDHGGGTYVNRSGTYYLADANGKPRDFTSAEAAEAAAAEFDGEVRYDDPAEGQRRSWSVVLPEFQARAAERSLVPESRRPRQDVRRLDAEPVQPKVGMIAKEITAIRDDIRKMFAKSDLPKNPQNSLDRVNGVRALMFDAMMSRARVLKAKYPNSRGLHQLMDTVFTEPGSGRPIYQTLTEGIQQRYSQFSNRWANALAANGLVNMTRAENTKLRNALLGVGAPAPAYIQKAADDLRKLMDVQATDARTAGLDFGEVTDIGYLTRLYDEARIVENAASEAEFMDDAAVLFSQHEFPAEVGGARGMVYERERLIRFVEIARQQQADPAIRQALERMGQSLQSYRRTSDLADIRAVESEVRGIYDRVAEGYGRQRAAAWLHGIKTPNMADGFATVQAPGAPMLKERVLGPAADTVMAKWMITDVQEILDTYGRAMSRKVEFAQRFGPTGNKVQEYLDQMTREGVKTHDSALAAQMAATVAGTMKIPSPTELNAVASWVHAIGYVAMLDKAVISSLAEPVAATLRTGDLRNALGPLVQVARAVRRAAGRPTKRGQEVEALAKAIGIVVNNGAEAVLMNQLGGDYALSPKPANLLSGFFRVTLLTGLTQSQRTFTTGTADAYLRGLARAVRGTGLTAGDRVFGWSPAQARAELAELGVADADGFADWLLAQGGTPDTWSLFDPSGRPTPQGQFYMAAVNRFVDQVIQNPNAGMRPQLASAGPAGRLIYGVTAFSYSFYENLLKGGVKRIETIAKRDGWTKASQQAFVRFAVPAIALFVAQTTVSTMRELLLNPSRWEDEEEEDRNRKLMELGLTRSFGLGGLDPIIQYLTGIKYGKSAAETAVGAAPGFFLQSLDGVTGLGSDRNSPNTSTTEFRAAQAVYSGVLQPTLNALLVKAGGGQSSVLRAMAAAGIIGAGDKGRDEFASLFGVTPERETELDRKFTEAGKELKALEAELKGRISRLPKDQWEDEFDALRQEYPDLLAGSELMVYADNPQNRRLGRAGVPMTDEDGGLRIRRIKSDATTPRDVKDLNRQISELNTIISTLREDRAISLQELTDLNNQSATTAFGEMDIASRRDLSAPATIKQRQAIVDELEDFRRELKREAVQRIEGARK
jgi:hypothetical protein